MKHLMRIAFSFLALMFCLCQPSFAEVPKTAYWYFESLTPNDRYPTQEQACRSGLDYLRTLPTWSAQSATFTRFDGYCYMDMVNNAGTPVPNFAYGRVYPAGDGCPANSTQNGASCTCNSGFNEQNGQCVKPAGKSKEEMCGADFTYAGWAVGLGKYNEPWAINGYVPSGEQCDAYTDADPGGTGCKVYFSATGTTKNDNGTTTTTGNFRPVPGAKAGEGVPCSPTYEGEGKDVVDSKPPEKCDGYEGTVGGETKCIPNVQNNGVDWAKTEKSEKKSDGTTVDTKVEQKCEKDKCTTTTTTTTKDAAGNTTSTSTSETKQDVVLFCKENPDKCKNGKPVADKGSGGGSGGGTGSGTGGNGDGSGSCTGSDCPDNNAPGGPGKVTMPGSGAPEIGSFYEREYKQGPVQLWSQKTAQLKESGLGALAANLMPHVGDGGVEPTWIIDLDFGPLGNYGQRDISPPSWVWGVIRAITILSALIVARRLVFGG